MKIFAIKNEADFDNTVAFLFYYEKPRKFYIELPENTDEWETPLLLSSFVKKGKRTINSHWSRIWVEQRIVPSDRQNIAQILKDNNIRAYDEFKLLMLSNGRCAQDDFYLSEISFSDLPEEIQKRRQRRIDDIVPLENERLLVFFADGVIKICNIKELIDENSSLGILLENRPELFPAVRQQTGGYGIYWDENMALSDSDLYEAGKRLPLSKKDFFSFISSRVVTTSEAADMLNCSRQNIDDLIKRNKLTPIKESSSGKLFLKSDIEKRDWE